MPYSWHDAIRYSQMPRYDATACPTCQHYPLDATNKLCPRDGIVCACCSKCRELCSRQKEEK